MGKMEMSIIKETLIALSVLVSIGFAAQAMAYPFDNGDRDHYSDRRDSGDYDHYRHHHWWHRDCYWVHHHDWNERVCR